MDIPVPVIAYMPRNQHDKYCWVVIVDIEVMLSNNKWITIPRGMRTDLSSVPQALWSILPPYGPFLLAALIHDYLYIFDYMREELGDREARLFADKEMLLWSNKLNKNWIDNYIRYYGVRLLGWMIFKRWNAGKLEELKELNLHLEHGLS